MSKSEGVGVYVCEECGEKEDGKDRGRKEEERRIRKDSHFESKTY